MNLSYLGLALRARKLTIGRYATINGCKRKQVKLILFARDASDKLQNEIGIFSVPMQIVNDANKIMLGKMINRHEVAVIGICDDHFVKAILQK
ncbi:ribosomal L7Ae/L30e/S12e/Gadd45 family protein [candidate division KSB1 bacterium]|nr:ribosomal L7Ae/L30e/S12e/Gadd45 family protein [candidate division KSB1 bacterium]